MKEEQDKLEKQLWDEREYIRRSHEEKVKVAKNKYASSLDLLFPYRLSCRAKMVGVGLSTQEAQVIHSTLHCKHTLSDLISALSHAFRQT
jgi:hypothetical protein